MKNRNSFLVLAVAGAVITLLAWGCSKDQTARSNNTQAIGPSALPDNGFKAVVTLVDPPAKLRTGQKETIQVKVKNASDVLWYARGAEVNNNPDNKFYLAVGDRWLSAPSETLVTNMDGRYGLDRDLRPGEESQVPLAITAPKEPGEYILEVDVLQEQVAWFHDKGSPTAKTKITIVR